MASDCFFPSPSQVNNALLIAHGALTTLALLLLELAAAVQGTEDAGLELVRSTGWVLTGVSLLFAFPSLLDT